MLLFGTAGVPISSKKRDTISGIVTCRELGLDCMEIEFVRGVRMGMEMAKKVREVAIKENIKLSVHAPYFINLNSREKSKVEMSKKRIIDSAKIGAICNAKDIVFHPAYYGSKSKKEVYFVVKREIEDILSMVEEDVILRPETTGKPSQFGTLEEILSLSQELDNVLPCIDFAHIHARYFGRYNTYEEFCEILEKVENALGKEALRNMHIHVSGIEYGKKGEKRHLNLKESDFNYKALLRSLKDFKVGGMVISESPNLEGDALLLKKEYENI